jgi:hypothetical protein
LQTPAAVWQVGNWTAEAGGRRRNRAFLSFTLVLRFLPDGTLKSWTLATTFPEEKKKLDPALAP